MFRIAARLARGYATRALTPTWAIEAAQARLAALSDAFTGTELARQQKELEPLARLVTQYGDVQKAITETRALSQDEDMRALCAVELDALDAQSRSILAAIPDVLLPPPDTAHLPVMVSINAGVGGTEATLCAQLLARMYQRYAENAGWRIEVVSQTDGTSSYKADGIKEMTMRISAASEEDDVYGKLRFESGVHRIQRIPSNDAKGRIQTSTVAVIVLPIYPESDQELVNPKDVVTETMRSRGAGGQHVNKTESAIRLTHTPTGISVSMQDSRSQHQNKAWAWEILRARLAERRQQAKIAARREARQEKVSTADRSERIRSYQIPQDRVTDHRISMSVGNVSGVFDGQLDELVGALEEDHTSRRIASIIAGHGDLE